MSSTRESADAQAAIWQDVEFGHYAADLPLWEELADAAGGPVLELGAGSGRVSLALARRGHELIAVEREPGLCAELERRAREEQLAVDVVLADLAALGDLRDASSPALALAPLHVLQQLEPADRGAALEALARILSPGGRLAAVVVDEASLRDTRSDSEALPDMRDVDGWVYSSEPLWVQLDQGAMRIRRLRRRVSPQGEIESSVHDEHLHRLDPVALEEEALAAGLSAAGRRPIASGPAEADSIAVLLEAPR